MTEFIDGGELYFEVDGGNQRPQRQGRKGVLTGISQFFTSLCGFCYPTNTNLKRTSFRNLFIYLAFLIIVCIVSYGMRSEYQFYITRAMSIYFTERMFGDRGMYFNEIQSIPDIWAFLSEIILPNLFPAITDGVNITTSRYILRENYLLGLVRLRLLRVRNDSCDIHELFRPYIYNCYNEYSEDSEDKSDFGLATGTAWIHHSAEELSETTYWGKLGVYGGCGYYEDLGPSFELAEERVTTLYQNFWIRRATRVVFIDFTVYNANVNLFSIVKFVLEVPATGGIWPTVVIHSVNLLRYVDSWDFFVLGCEILFCCFTIYYLFEEIIEITRQRLTYVRSFWNLLDFIILMMSIVCICFAVYRSILVNSMLEKLLTDPNHYPPFGILGVWQTYYNNTVATLVFLCWIKVFKYLSFNRTMTQLSTTLAKCTKDVGGFSLMFCIVFLAYAQFGYLLFGAQLHDFSRFHLSVFSLVRLILGDFDFDAMRETSRIMGSIFFVSYVFVVFFILLNMFLAIISDTYTEVKTELDKNPVKHDFAEFFGKVYSKVTRFLCEARFKKTEKNSSSSEISTTDRSVRSNTLDGSKTKKTGTTGSSQLSSRYNRKDTEGTDNAVDRSEVSKANEKMERLSTRLEDLSHELEQVQSSILFKMDEVQRQLTRLNTAETIDYG